MIYYRKTLFGSGPKLTAVQYLKATINIALKHPELKDAFKGYLEERKKFIE